MRSRRRTYAELVAGRPTPDTTRSILGGQLRAGQPLRQEEIARQMGLSRLPIREALHRLSAEGLVVRRPRRGYVVASLDRNEIEDIFDLRIMLEERAGYLATLSRTEEDIKTVETILQEMDALSKDTTEHWARWSAANRSFHATIFEASRRKRLCRIAETLRDAVEPYIRMVVSTSPGELARAHNQHHEIFDAFRRGDAECVGTLSRAHCAYTAEFLISAFDSGKLPKSTTVQS